MINFRKLEIWQRGLSLSSEVYKLAARLPPAERFGICAQMQRAVVSIPSNIAEGCSRSSKLEYKRFLEISMGSAFELETQLLIVRDTYAELSHEVDSLVLELQNIQPMINGYIEALKADIKATQGLKSKV